jgi:hypothetical protein
MTDGLYMISLGIAAAIRVGVVPPALFSSCHLQDSCTIWGRCLIALHSHNYCIMTPLIPRACPHVLDSRFSISVRKRRSHGLDSLWLTMHSGFSLV